MKKLYSILFLIPFVFASQIKAQITTYNDVASVFYKRCTSCHHVGGIGPMALMNFNDVSSWSSSIDTYVRNNSMPPWSPDTTYSRFLHERIITAPEKAAILKWVADGSLEGNSALAPTAPLYGPVKYELCPEPTVTLRIPTFHSNASASNSNPYDCFSVPTNLTKDRWLRAFEIIPGDRSIVHHVVITVDTASNKTASDLSGNCNNQGGQFGIGGWSAGSAAVVFPGQAPMKAGIRIPKGSNLILQIHYAPGSGGKIDSTGIRMYYYPEGETGIRPVYSDTWLQNWFMNIRANDSATYSASHSVGNTSISLFSTSPHSHNVCTRITNYADKGNSVIPIIKIKSWDYNWQGNYYFPKMLKIPSGYTIRGTHFYNNTKSNLHDKTPNVAVSAGRKTSDEMLFDSFQWLDYKTGDENIDIAALLKCDTLLVCKPLAAGLITGLKTICVGQSGVSYTVPLIDNAATYTWSYSGTGATIHGNGDSVIVDFSANATAGNLTVAGVNTCGVSGFFSAKYAVTIANLANPSTILVKNSCGSSELTSSSTTGTYLWSPSGETTQKITVTTGGTYSVTLSAGGSCSATSASTIVTINPSPKITLPVPASRCGVGTVTLGATATTGTVNWYTTATGGTSIGTGTSFTTPSLTATTTYFVDASDATCTSTPRTAIIATVNSVPTASISGSTSVCKNSTALLTISLKGTAPWTFNYGTAAGFNLVSNISASTYTVAVGIGTYTVANISDASGCAGATSDSVTITENSIVDVSNILTFCNFSDSTYIVEFDISGGDGNYTVMGNAGKKTNNTHFKSSSITTGANYSFSVTDGKHCSPFMVNGIKACDCGATAEISGGGAVCSNSSANITVKLTGTSPWKFTYAIDGIAKPEITNIVNSTYTFTASTSGAYTLVSVSDSTCTGSTSGTANVSTIKPTASLSGGGSVCIGATTNLSFDLISGSAPWSLVYGLGASTYTVNSGSSSNILVPVSVGGIYSIVSVTVGMCNGTGSGTALVKINPLPTIGINANPSETVCLGDTVTLTGTGALSYIWSDGIIDGKPFVVKVSNTYSVVATDVNFCSNTAYKSITVNSCKVGIIENGLPIQNLKVYPNPTSGLFDISIKNATFKELTIVVVTMLGQEVYSVLDKNISTEYHAEINLETLPKGIYYLKLSTGTYNVIKKLIIQ